MKLKYTNINGYGVLVDESAEIKEGDLCEYKNKVFVIKKGDNELFQLANRVLFAEPELNLPTITFSEEVAKELGITGRIGVLLKP